MKKIAVAAFTVLVLIVAFYIRSSHELMDLSRVSPSMTMDEQNVVYFIENTNTQSKIYGISQEGTLISCYVETAASKQTTQNITKVTYYNGYVYFLRENRNKKNNTLKDYELVKLNRDTGKAELVLTLGKNKLKNIDNIWIAGDLLFISQISDDGKTVFVYTQGFTENNKTALTMLLQESVPEENNIVSAAYVNSVLYVLLQSGNVMIFNNKEQYLQEGEQALFTCLNITSDSVFLFDSMNNQIFWGMDKIIDGEQIAPYKIITGTGKIAQSLVMLGVDEKGDKVLLTYDENGLHRINDLQVSISMRLTLLVPGQTPFFAVFVIVTALIYCLMFLLLKSKTLAVKISILAGVFMVITGTAGLSLIYHKTAGFLEAQKAENHTYQTELAIQSLSKELLKNAADADYYGSENYKAVLEKLSAEAKVVKDKVTYEIISYFGEEAEILLSEDKIKNIPVRLSYTGEFLRLLEQAEDEEETVTGIIEIMGVKQAVSIKPLKVTSSSTVYVAAISSLEGLKKKENTYLYPLTGVMAGIVLFSILVMYFIIRFLLNPLKPLIASMESAVEGDYSPRKLKTPKNEIGALAVSLGRLCNSFEMKQYANDKLVHAFYRFVPRQIDKLLDKNTILDVSVGDVTSVTGTVGILSVTNRDKYHPETSLEDHMTFANYCFQYINDSNEKYGGLLLSNDFNLSVVKLLYPDSLDGAINCGIEILQGIYSGKLPVTHIPKAFLMLHAASFLYGVAGTREQVFPFLTSDGLETLSTYMEDFKHAGTRLVITEETLKKLKGTYYTRYIGFLASEDGKDEYKLYEILDVYEEKEFLLRKRLNEKFKEALQLFYKNDFYLARNVFSQVLKECPEDGIARWYLFACERFFNRERNVKVTYNLFSFDDI